MKVRKWVICVLCVCIVAAMLMSQGCMGFGGSQRIISKRVKGAVKGPKNLANWDKYQWPAYNGPRKRIAIGVVKNASGNKFGDSFAKAIEAELHTILLATKRFVLLEGREENVKGILDEQDLASAGLVHSASGVQMGKMIGAAYSIDATIIRLQDQAGGGALGGIGASDDGKFGGFTLGGSRCEVEIQVQIKDNQTREVIASITGEGYDAKASFGFTEVKVTKHSVTGRGLGSYAKTSLGRAAKRAVNEAVLSIVNTLGGKKWKGVVVDVPDDMRIAIKGGTNMNLRKGMRLKVFHKLQELIDPTTGESLGWDSEEVATVIIVKVLDKASFAKHESGTLEDVEVGDYLEMIEAASAPAGGKGGDASQL